MKLYEMKTILKASVLSGGDEMEKVITAGGAADLMEDVLASAAEGCALLTGVTTEQVLRTAKIAHVGAIVIVRGKQPSESFIELSESYQIPLLKTEYSLFVACGRLYMNGIRGLDGSW